MTFDERANLITLLDAAAEVALDLGLTATAKAINDEIGRLLGEAQAMPLPLGVGDPFKVADTERNRDRPAAFVGRRWPRAW